MISCILSTVLFAASPAFAGPPERITDATVTLMAAGDIMLDRGTGKQIHRYGPGYPLKFARSLLKLADISIANLECVLSNRGFAVNQQFLFHANPELAEALQAGGITVLNLANNHSMDCGSEGLADTIASLESAGIRYCGVETAGVQQPVILTVKGIRIAFLGFCDFRPSTMPASPPNPSIAYASDESVRLAVTSARRLADAVVVSFHWGIEYSRQPAERQIHLARLAAESGADVVLGHHPHVLQGLHVISAHSRRCLVAWSLGSFVWDGHGEPEKKTGILKCRFDKRGLLGAALIPMRIEHCAPRPAGPIRELYRHTSGSSLFGRRSSARLNRNRAH